MPGCCVPDEGTTFQNRVRSVSFEHFSRVVPGAVICSTRIHGRCVLN
jgi:hypothetical protein